MLQIAVFLTFIRLRVMGTFEHVLTASITASVRLLALSLLVAVVSSYHAGWVLSGIARPDLC